MARVSQPELKRYLDKKVTINIQGGRRVQGTLRGFDVFLNLVVDDTLELTRPEGGSNSNQWKETAQCGTVVVRGNSVTSLEGMERVNTKIQ
ncbi:hypothetical protein CBS101457_000648 [Exobasidium rhododendri]|nr:hypothetical protein CBS101457_000648 [Exobasidium rhododendri]